MLSKTATAHSFAINLLSTMGDSEVIFENVNNAGVVTLNRPKSLNALNYNMVNRMLPQLLEWERTKTCVITKGIGKAFCAGGDIRALETYDHISKAFASIEYNINHLIGRYTIPYIALIDGIAMGGGLGISVHGRYRVVTENAVVAMPETKIGLLPDVGGTFFLPRLKNHLGFYMGLTGKRLKGRDVVASGIATHFVPKARLAELESDLTRCSNDMEIKRCLGSFCKDPGDLSLVEQLKNIDYCFSPNSVEEVWRRLSEVNNAWSEETLKTLSLMCPLVLKVTLRALHRGQHQTLGECLQTEYRVTTRCFGSHNFKEGVRALLTDRDNNPQWRPASLAEVTEQEVESYFRRLPEDKELSLVVSKL